MAQGTFIFGVRLKKGNSQKTEEQNRQAMFRVFLKTGKIGCYKPMDAKDARNFANKIAIAFRKRAVVRGGSNATPGRQKLRQTAEHTQLKGPGGLFGESRA